MVADPCCWSRPRPSRWSRIRGMTRPARDPTAEAVDARPGLEREVVDPGVVRALGAALRRGRHRPADVRPAGGPGHDPGRRRRAPRVRRPGRRGSRATSSASTGTTPPIGAASWPSPSTSCSPRADRRRRPDRRRPRRPLPDDRRPQGPGRLRLPRPADRHRPVRPERSARGLAVDRQLLPRRRRDLPDHGLPRRRGPARGDEPGALRLAGRLGERTRPTSSGRPAPRATSRRSTTAAPSSRRDPANVILNQFSEFGNHLVHYLVTGRALDRIADHLRIARPGLRVHAFVSATGSPGRSPPATTSRSAKGRRSSRSRRSSARPCSRTASASTTSRASATSTSR